MKLALEIIATWVTIGPLLVLWIIPRLNRERRYLKHVQKLARDVDERPLS